MMIKDRNGCSGRFDYHQWSAPFYETPEEALNALNNAGLFNKAVKSVCAIGRVQDHCGSDYDLSNILYQAGIPNEHQGALLNDMQFRVSLTMSEPFQLVFDDHSTLEILPIRNGSLRIGINTIPAGTCHGLSKSNIDANILFGCDLKGRTLKKAAITKSKTEHTHCSIANNTLSHDVEEDIKHELILTFNHYVQLSFCWGYVDVYKIEYDHHHYSVNHVQIQKALKDTDDIGIFSGTTRHEVFWILPTDKNGNFDQNGQYSRGFSVYEDELLSFMKVFLNRYLDPTIQDYCEPDDPHPHIESEENTLYTKESVEKMIQDMRNTIELLQENFESEGLKEIIDRFKADHFDRAADRYTISEEERKSILKNNVRISVDFYERVCRELERMIITLPDDQYVCFNGP